MKKFLVSLFTASVLLLCAGCESCVNMFDMLQSDGATHIYQMGETAKTSYFNYTVNYAETLSMINDYTPNNKNHCFLMVNVTIENTYIYNASIPMYDTDFVLSWEDMGDSTIYAEPVFTPDQLPDEYTLFKRERITGNLIFIVPTDTEEFSLLYHDYWND